MRTAKEHDIDYQYFMNGMDWFDSSFAAFEWKTQTETSEKEKHGIEIISSGSIWLLFIGIHFDLWKIAILLITIVHVQMFYFYRK